MDLSLETEKKFIDIWINNIENATNIIHNDLVILKDIYVNKSAIIVGAGTSLDDNFDELKYNFDKLKQNHIIIYVDLVAVKLIKQGLIPDYIISVDPNEVLLNLYQELYKYKDKDFDIILPMVVDYRIKKLFPKAFYFVYDDITEYQRQIQDKFNIQCKLDAGFVVGNTAISLCKYLGCNKIYILGCDYAYKKDKYYSDFVFKLKRTEDSDNIKEQTEKSQELQQYELEDGMLTNEFFVLCYYWILRQNIEIINLGLGLVKNKIKVDIIDIIGVKMSKQQKLWYKQLCQEVKTK